MKNNILVSIVIPVYNSQNYLKKCLDSVINQTYANLEIIIINDGSNDNCQKIINNYSKDDDRIISFEQQRKGVLNARKYGISYAHGDYICSIDSDDYIETNYIETLLKQALMTDADFVQCAFNCFGLKNDTYIFDQYIENIEGKQDLVLKKYLDGTHYIGSQIFTKLFKAKVIKDALSSSLPKVDEGDDVVYFIYYIKKSHIISSISDVLYHYRYRRDSLSHNISLKWLIIELSLISKLTRLIKKEYKTIDRETLLQWNKKYKRNRIIDYLNYKKKL